MLSWLGEGHPFFFSFYVPLFRKETVAHDMCRKAGVAEHCDTHQLTVTSTGCQARIYEHKAESVRIAAWCAVNRSLSRMFATGGTKIDLYP
jgi:hypothetical protein